MAIYHEDIVNIDLESGTIHRSFMNHAIGSGDDDANRFGVKVFRKGEPVDLNGCSCQAVFINAEGTKIALTSHGTVNRNVAYVTLPQACYNVEGNFCLAVKLIGGGVTGTMRIVDGTVDNTGTVGTVAPTSDVPTYQEVLSVYGQAVDAVDDVNIFESALLDYDSMVISDDELIYPSSTTRSGIEFTKTQENGLFVGHMEGTAEADIEINLIVGGTTTKPGFLVPGTVQYIDIEGLPEGVDVRLWMYATGYTSEKQIFTGSTVLPVPAPVL